MATPRSSRCSIPTSPSWLSYLVDQVRARQGGRELFDAVYERWSQLPPDARPELLVFGAPGFNVLHREFTDGRDHLVGHRPAGAPPRLVGGTTWT
jgi:uncharacterized membrane protein